MFFQLGLFNNGDSRQLWDYLALFFMTVSDSGASLRHPGQIDQAIVCTRTNAITNASI